MSIHKCPYCHKKYEWHKDGQYAYHDCEGSEKAIIMNALKRLGYKVVTAQMKAWSETPYSVEEIFLQKGRNKIALVLEEYDNHK